MDFSTIVHYISIASPYICGAWALFYIFLNHKISKDYLLERNKIRQVLFDKYNIDLDKDVFSEFK